jgi:hypothetical protein
MGSCSFCDALLHDFFYPSLHLRLLFTCRRNTRWFLLSCRTGPPFAASGW